MRNVRKERYIGVALFTHITHAREEIICNKKRSYHENMPL